MSSSISPQKTGLGRKTLLIADISDRRTPAPASDGVVFTSWRSSRRKTFTSEQSY